MAWLEDLGKTIGQVAHGVGDAKDIVVGAAQETYESLQQQKTAEDARRCPGCGQPLNGVVAVCPLCGYEFHAEEGQGSVTCFAQDLRKLEGRRNSLADSFSNAFSNRTASSTDDRIAGHIRSYVIPNTKEDLFEFMLLASGNMNANAIAKLDKRKGFFGDSHARRQERDGISEVVLTAWSDKFEQAYQNAKISFGDDPDFQKIQSLYDNKKREIREAKSRV